MPKNWLAEELARAKQEANGLPKQIRDPQYVTVERESDDDECCDTSSARREPHHEGASRTLEV